MPWPEAQGVIACLCVIQGQQPVRVASHAGGDWQMYCAWDRHDFNDPSVLAEQLRVVHLRHLLARDASLAELADLPPDMAAERDAPGLPWRRYPDSDD